MKVLIVEDETSSYENLLSIIKEVAPDTEVVGNTESVTETVRWLNEHQLPDLIFMDIHLSDDSAFAIFNQIEVKAPIVFTTAYDEYALDAFHVNSIEYLLKPIKAKDVRRAIEKFHILSKIDLTAYLGRMGSLKPETRWQTRLLIPHKDMLVPVAVTDISYIYSTEKATTVYLNNGDSLLYSKSLEAILSTLDPHLFFRANKQFAVSRDSVKKITVWYDNRLLITLNIDTPERLFVSKNRAAEFKQWMTEG
ncbi:MAG: response regulator transcription factor [Prevotella sp.]|nr:response regulator transcription factor [Prevotella sp.]